MTNQDSDWPGNAPPSRRLLDILKTAASGPEDEYSLRLISSTYSAVLLLSILNSGFWDEVSKSDTFGSITQGLLLDSRAGVRNKMSQIIREACQKEQ